MKAALIGLLGGVLLTATFIVAFDVDDATTAIAIGWTCGGLCTLAGAVADGWPR